MKRVLVKIVAITLSVALLKAGGAFAAQKADEIGIGMALNDSYKLIETKQYAQAKIILEQVLAKDSGNPLAMNNMAAVMVAEKKFDTALSLLKQALPKAKGCRVQANMVAIEGLPKGCFFLVKPAAGDPEAQQKVSTLIVEGGKVVSRRSEDRKIYNDLAAAIIINIARIEPSLHQK